MKRMTATILVLSLFLMIIGTLGYVSGFMGDIDETDLVFQAGVFLVMASAYPRFHLYQGLNAHGQVMVLATLLNTASILAVMIPLALVEATDIPYILIYAHPFLFAVHVLIGSAAWVAAVTVSVRWVVKRDVRKCFGRRTMQATLLLWTLSFILGISTYFLHYLPISTI